MFQWLERWSVVQGVPGSIPGAARFILNSNPIQSETRIASWYQEW